jgi:hypothetical protein
LDCSREGSSMMEGVESATEVDILRVIGVISSDRIGWGDALVPENGTAVCYR